MSTVAIIPARGGSKGILRKNLISIAGCPLVVWSIRQALAARAIDSVWVSSEDKEILDVAARYGANTIPRPAELSSDEASSESAWLHALETIEHLGHFVDCVVGMQPTSPLRSPDDLDNGIKVFRDNQCDSVLSVVEIEDFFIWRHDNSSTPKPINYDLDFRQRRQSIERQYLENGSFYIFKPDLLRKKNNRLGGKIGMTVMSKHKMFQIDSPEDIPLCEVLMTGYGLDRV
jgi:CMP-N,N'-diacetyllegionaminic acid synthase